MMTDYVSRFRGPPDGSDSFLLRTYAGTVIATGFRRLVVGGHGPFVEIGLDQLVTDGLTEVDTQHYYFVELRSCDVHSVMVYIQLRRVDYADYTPGMAYVSPFDVTGPDGTPLIVPLQRRARTG